MIASFLGDLGPTLYALGLLALISLIILVPLFLGWVFIRVIRDAFFPKI